MLSILIPTYNYDVFPLVLELHKQALECGIAFEILVQDDASDAFLIENQKINSIKNCSFSRNETNLGRGRNINFLAKKAQYNGLLIMDCDTFPTQDNFIQNYISEIKKREKIVFGGIEYQKEQRNNDQLLRWIYGKARESLSVEKRNTNPNGNALTSNLLVQKEVFLSTRFDESITKYGYEDLVFLSSLKKKGILVKHIDNPAYHLGLESSKQFLEKTKTALENLTCLFKSDTVDDSGSKILKTYFLLKKLQLVPIISFLFKKTEAKLEANLISQNPSLFLFDLYKLGCFSKYFTS